MAWVKQRFRSVLMYLRHCCTAQGFDSTGITDSGFCSFPSPFSSLSSSLTKYTPDSSFPWVPPHTATRDNLGKHTTLSTSVWLNAGPESVEEMGEIEMQGRTLLTYTPAYHTCRILQQITEGLTLPSRTRTLLIPHKTTCSSFTKWEVSWITGHIVHNTAKQSGDINFRTTYLIVAATPRTNEGRIEALKTLGGIPPSSTNGGELPG